MGDLGYFDKKGNLRFLGRKANVFTPMMGPLKLKGVSLPSINFHAFENLPIGIGSVPRQEPCIVVEPNPDEMQKQGERALREEILNVCKSSFSRFGIQRVFFERRIPVDARHNAKIHRLALSRKWTKLASHKSKLGKLS